MVVFRKKYCISFLLSGSSLSDFLQDYSVHAEVILIRWIWPALVNFPLPERLPYRPDARLPSFVIGKTKGLI